MLISSYKSILLHFGSRVRRVFGLRACNDPLVLYRWVISMTLTTFEVIPKRFMLDHITRDRPVPSMGLHAGIYDARYWLHNIV